MKPSRPLDNRGESGAFAGELRRSSGEAESPREKEISPALRPGEDENSSIGSEVVEWALGSALTGRGWRMAGCNDDGGWVAGFWFLYKRIRRSVCAVSDVVRGSYTLFKSISIPYGVWVNGIEVGLSDFRRAVSSLVASWSFLVGACVIYSH